MNNFNNIDYISFFNKLLIVQSNLTEKIFIKKIKFISPEETWKQYISYGNNILIFFDNLNIKNKILFIKYLDYHLLSENEKLILLNEIINEINDKISNFSKISKINVIELYDELFNHYNNEEIIIEYLLDFNINHDKKDINLIEDIKNWINNFNTNIEKYCEKKLISIE